MIAKNRSRMMTPVPTGRSPIPVGSMTATSVKYSVPVRSDRIR